MSLRVEHYDGLNRTPALDIAMEGHLAMMRGGLAGESLMLGSNDQAIVVFPDEGEESDTPLGVMTWCHSRHWRELQIILAYVRPAARQQGVAMALWDALVGRAQEMDVGTISSSTRLINAPMRALAAKQGRREVGVTLEYDVPPAGDR